MQQSSVKVTADQLDLALIIHETYGCSDLFPLPFEFLAIRDSWDKIRPVLENVELLSNNPKPFIKMSAPKQRYTLRPAHLIDPIDSLLFTALVIKIGPIVEAKRVANNVVHSYRYFTVEAGKMYADSPNWDTFQVAIESYTDKFSFVAISDIVDFFPRVYTHRLENAIHDMTGLEPETKAIMRFVNSWSGGDSYGIPVGPIGSNLLAEILLHEVDEYLLSHGFTFVRYVDDYYFFCNSESECIKALFLLGSRLQDTQGLSLNTYKTRVFTNTQFADEKKKQNRPDIELRDTIIKKVFNGNPYATVSYEQLTLDQQIMIDHMDAKRMLEAALKGDQVVDISAIKFVLNVLTALRRPELVDLVLDNLGRLYPVSDSVARFLNVFDTVDSADRIRIGTRLIEFINSIDYVSDFQTLCLLEPFTHSKNWNNLGSLRKIAREYPIELIRRQAILALGQIGDRSAILDFKVRVRETVDWEQRAIIYACRKLPSDEKKAFYDHVVVPGEWKLESLLTKAVKNFSKSTS